jgi:hypothetical protein
LTVNPLYTYAGDRAADQITGKNSSRNRLSGPAIRAVNNVAEVFWIFRS